MLLKQRRPHDTLSPFWEITIHQMGSNYFYRAENSSILGFFGHLAHLQLRKSALKLFGVGTIWCRTIWCGDNLVPEYKDIQDFPMQFSIFSLVVERTRTCSVSKIRLFDVGRKDPRFERFKIRSCWKFCLCSAWFWPNYVRSQSWAEHGPRAKCLGKVFRDANVIVFCLM